jgi:hypothetical protein
VKEAEVRGCVKKADRKEATSNGKMEAGLEKKYACEGDGTKEPRRGGGAVKEAEGFGGVKKADRKEATSDGKLEAELEKKFVCGGDGTKEPLRGGGAEKEAEGFGDVKKAELEKAKVLSGGYDYSGEEPEKPGGLRKDVEEEAQLGDLNPRKTGDVKEAEGIGWVKKAEGLGGVKEAEGPGFVRKAEGIGRAREDHEGQPDGAGPEDQEA